MNRSHTLIQRRGEEISSACEPLEWFYVHTAYTESELILMVTAFLHTIYPQLNPSDTARDDAMRAHGVSDVVKS
jgi:hypothetical protein